jgi:DNA-binding XRE family transcriptional regulator
LPDHDLSVKELAGALDVSRQTVIDKGQGKLPCPLK